MRQDMSASEGSDMPVWSVTYAGTVSFIQSLS